MGIMGEYIGTAWSFRTCLFFIIFPYIGNFIIPTDFHIFQRGWNHRPENRYLGIFNPHGIWLWPWIKAVEAFQYFCLMVVNKYNKTYIRKTEQTIHIYTPTSLTYKPQNSLNSSLCCSNLPVPHVWWWISHEISIFSDGLLIQWNPMKSPCFDTSWYIMIHDP